MGDDPTTRGSRFRWASSLKPAVSLYGAALPNPALKFVAKQAACFETMLGVMRRHSLFLQVVLTCFVISCFMFWSSPTWADQNDPELDRLFSALLGADNLVQGSRITEEIWQRWRQVDDTVIGDLLASGIIAMNAHDLGLALDSFDQVIQKAPAFAEGWNKRATVYYLMGEYNHSVRDIRQTLLLEPRHFGAMAGFAWILLRQRDFEMAEHVLRRALSVNPFLVDVRRQLRALMDRSD